MYNNPNISDIDGLCLQLIDSCLNLTLINLYNSPVNPANPTKGDPDGIRARQVDPCFATEVRPSLRVCGQG